VNLLVDFAGFLGAWSSLCPKIRTAVEAPVEYQGALNAIEAIALWHKVSSQPEFTTDLPGLPIDKLISLGLQIADSTANSEGEDVQEFLTCQCDIAGSEPLRTIVTSAGKTVRDVMNGIAEQLRSRVGTSCMDQLSVNMSSATACFVDDGGFSSNAKLDDTMKTLHLPSEIGKIDRAAGVLKIMSKIDLVSNDATGTLGQLAQLSKVLPAFVAVYQTHKALSTYRSRHADLTGHMTAEEVFVLKVQAFAKDPPS
jgi:hypothetical protein